MGPNLVIPTCHKIHLTLEKGPIHVIPLGHKIHLTLEKGTYPCNTYKSQNTFLYTGKGDPSMQYMQVTKYILHQKRGPIHAILTYRIEPTLEKGTHLCNTYISNETYSGKGNPSMQYLHIKQNLHWKKEPIYAIPTYQMKPTLENGLMHTILTR